MICKVNSCFFFAFIYVVTIYSFASYTKVLLPESASEHGYTYDTLLWISFALILFVQTVIYRLYFTTLHTSIEELMAEKHHSSPIIISLNLFGR